VARRSRGDAKWRSIGLLDLFYFHSADFADIPLETEIHPDLWRRIANRGSAEPTPAGAGLDLASQSRGGPVGGNDGTCRLPPNGELMDDES